MVRRMDLQALLVYEVFYEIIWEILCVFSLLMMFRSFVVVNDSNTVVWWVSRSGTGNINHVHIIFHIWSWLDYLGLSAMEYMLIS